MKKMKYVRPVSELYDLKDDEEIITTSTLSENGDPDEEIPGGWGD